MKDWNSIRTDIRKQIPVRYNPYLHLLLPSCTALLLMVAAVNSTTISGIIFISTWICLLFFEWFAHKYILHRPFWGLRKIFKQHSTHHLLYHHDRMAISSFREVYFVLIPLHSIMVLALTLTPLLLVISYFSINLCWNIIFASMGFFIFYESLHLIHHLPIPFFLRKYHQTHHNLRFMHKWNFNVTVPLADKILKTLKKDENI